LLIKDLSHIQTAADRNRTGTGISTHGILSPCFFAVNSP